MRHAKINIMPGEKIIYEAKIHWLIFLPGIVWLALNAAMAIFFGRQDVITIAVGGVIDLFAVISLIRALITKLSVGLVVTSKRVIIESGLIRRFTSEIYHNKIESINIDQGIIGRSFDCGDVVIRGTSGAVMSVFSVDTPLVFRRRVMKAIDVN